MRTRNITALLAALLLTFALTACGSQNNSQAGGNVIPGTSDNAGGQVQTPAPSAADDAAATLGSVNGGTYTNSFAGISCTLDDSWLFYTDEQIAELNGFVVDGTDNEELKKRLEESSSIQDMYVSSTDGLMTMNVTFVNMGLMGKTVTPQDVAELSAEQIPAALESYGLSDVTAKVTAVDFAGQKNVPAVAVSGTMQDVPMYELVVCLKAGNYSFTVTLCSFTEDMTADMAALFSAAE